MSIENTLLERVQGELKHIDELCVPSAVKCKELNNILKSLFDYSTAAAERSFGPFDQLLVEGMDTESIWEQLRSRNGPLTKFIKRKTTSLIKTISGHEALTEARTHRVHKRGDDDEAERSDDYEYADEDEKLSEEPENQSSSGEEMDEDDDFEEGEGEKEEEEEDWDENEVDDEEDEGGEDVSGASDENASEDAALEDYDSDGMEAWLDQQEEADEKHRNKMSRLEQLLAHKGAVEEGDSAAEEDDEMLAARALYEDSDDDGAGTSARFQDFFGDRPKGKGKGKASKPEPKTKSKRLAKDDDDEDDDDEEEDVDETGEDDVEDEEEEEGFGEDGDEGYSEDGSAEQSEIDEEEGEEAKGATDTGKLTAYQKQKRKMAEDIKNIEADLMGKKSWELRGELSAKDRPENSLLEISTEIERASKPAPVVTQEHTSSIEDMIIKRITEGRFDDVQAPDPSKAPVKSDDFELSQERSRLGLGEIYADAFLAKSGEAEGASGPKQDSEATTELKALFHKVCRSLDALAHFHYTPRPVVAEAGVTAQKLPSIAMEDVTPATEGGYSTFAPEEAHSKKRGRDAALMADAELTGDDRRRLRQASKATRRKDRKAAGLEESARAARGEGSAKYESRKTDEILRADKRVVEGKSSDQTQYAKSGQFFERLQAQAQQEIAAGGKAQKKKKTAAPSQSSSRVKM
jgi:U3 small nucleolar RNA-associated protein MPP10